MKDGGTLSELLLQQSPACQWMVSKDGVFRCVYGDAVPVFGLPAADLVGQAVSQVLKPMADVWMARFARAFAGDTVTLREKHGQARWDVSVFPIRAEFPAGTNSEIHYAGGLARQAASTSTAEQELRHTVLGALKSQEFERSMVARFLHDSIGQNLTALGLQLDLVRMDVEKFSPETCSRIAQIQQLLGGIMEEVREYSYELSPSAVERAGFRPALERFIQNVRARFSGPVSVKVDPSLKLDPRISRAMFRIVREAVENSVQHSSCSAIEIAVKSTRTGAVLEIRDNGRGFDPADPSGSGCRGLGLLSMEHFAAEGGLELGITSNPKIGTIVRAAAQEGE